MLGIVLTVVVAMSATHKQAPADLAGDDQPRVFATLEQLQEHPELTKPPEVIVPRFGYLGRLLALCGPDKSGKSTLAAHAMAALSWGRPFLEEPVATRTGRSVLLGLEEAVGDEVRRLTDLNANPIRLQILHHPRRDILQRTHDLLEEWPADLVVVDSLSEYARVTMGEVPANGDDAGWSAVVRPLVALARERDVAVVVLHHVRRSDGQYRGASEIAAAVDALMEMEVPKQAADPTERKFTGRGRWTIEPFSIVLTDDGYELAGGSELSLDARVLLHIERVPGISQRDIRSRVGARMQSVVEAIHRLENRQAVEYRDNGYHATTTQRDLRGVL